jgi:pectin methylesterase-like acyl-CoA thioesterase
MNRFMSVPTGKYRSACARAVAVLVFVGVCASAVTIKAADDSLPPKSTAADGASTNSAEKPMVIRNRDGTFTVQKGIKSKHSKDAKSPNGLTIPAQVVVPIVRTTEHSSTQCSKRRQTRFLVSSVTFRK